jgi:DNA-directed RNA polymerase subunit RPC12/RpoP
MSYFDGVTITLNCSECNTEFENQLGRLKVEPEQVCANCGHVNIFDSASLAYHLKLVDDWINNPWVNTKR